NYLVQNLPYGLGLLAAPGSFAVGFTSAVRDCIIEGDGQLAVRLIAGQNFGFDGLIGYTGTVVTARMDVSELTLDGNYKGVANGAIPQHASGAMALVSITWPYTNSSGTYNGLYHDWHRVRFYRPAGFGFQGTLGQRLIGCT